MNPLSSLWIIAVSASAAAGQTWVAYLDTAYPLAGPSNSVNHVGPNWDEYDQS